MNIWAASVTILVRGEIGLVRAVQPPRRFAVRQHVSDGRLSARQQHAGQLAKTLDCMKTGYC